ncbi:MAG: hypothetical protein ACRC1J_07390 [Sandaracinobacteroides sp.]
MTGSPTPQSLPFWSVPFRSVPFRSVQFWGRIEDVGCLIEINHTLERFGAHVHLDGEPEIAPGDRVCVYGEPIDVVPGQDMQVRRRARIERAGALARAWTRLRGNFEVAELYEVSFTTQQLDSGKPR